MRIAGHTMGTPEHTLDQAVRLFASLGLDGIEIICQDGYACGISPSASRAEAADLGRLIRHQRLEPVSLTPYTNAINALDAAERGAALDELRRVIALAGAIGAPYVRVYGGSFPPGTDQPEARWANLVASLRQLGRLAADAGVTLAVENHFNTMTRSARLTRRLIDEVDHPNVRILYDQANLTFQGDEDEAEAIPLQAGRIALVHVKDLVWKDGAPSFTASQVFVVNEDERKVRSRVVGDGVLRWDRILRRLVETGYDGWLSLEYERRWHPQDLPPAEDGMRRSAEHVRRLLSGLSSVPTGR
jgi:L-ribulose-5-phosphate 3-epimerase